MTKITLRPIPHVIYRDAHTTAHHALCTCMECQDRWDDLVRSTPQPALSLVDQMAYESLYHSEWYAEFPSFL